MIVRYIKVENPVLQPSNEKIYELAHQIQTNFIHPQHKIFISTKYKKYIYI